MLFGGYFWKESLIKLQSNGFLSQNVIFCLDHVLFKAVQWVFITNRINYKLYHIISGLLSAVLGIVHGACKETLSTRSFKFGKIWEKNILFTNESLSLDIPAPHIHSSSARSVSSQLSSFDLQLCTTLNN